MKSRSTLPKKLTSKSAPYLKASLIDVKNGTQAYATLRKRITQEGILDRAYGYYTILIVVVFLGFFFSVYQVIINTSLLAIGAWSVILAFFSVQMAGLLHDAGHRAIAKSNAMNDLLGIVFGGLLAMSFDQWKIKHNKHHASPNEEDEDPDVDLPVLSFSTERYKTKTGLAKLLRRYQAYLYYPMGSLVVFSSRLGNFLRYGSNIRTSHPILILLFLVGVFIWFIVPFLVFPLSKALVFNLFFNTVSGFYLLNVFAPNHKGMPFVKKGVKLSFLEHQIVTTRNVEANWLNDFIYMGLNYQMEHHLFPNCPRNKLGRITPYLKEVCKQLKLPYVEAGMIESNKIILGQLREVVAEGEKRLSDKRK